MSEQDTALEENEELDLVSLLAKQGAEDDEYDDEDEVDGELPDDPEALKQLLLREREIKSKRNKSLKKSKQAIHRTNEENEALQRRLEQLEQLVNQPKDGAENNEREAQEWADRVLDNPTEAIKYTDQKQRMLEDKLANYLGSFEQKITAQIDELKGLANPERIKYESELNTLRMNPTFAKMDDDSLIQIIKGLSVAKQKTPRGGIGGGRAGKTDNSEFKLTDEQRAAMGF